MHVFLIVLLAILVVAGLLVLNLAVAVASVILLRRIGLSDEAQAQVLEEAAAKLAAERWIP